MVYVVQPESEILKLKFIAGVTGFAILDMISNYDIMIYFDIYMIYIYYHIRCCKGKLCYLELDLCVASANRDDIC